MKLHSPARWGIVALAVAGLTLSACAGSTPAPPDTAAPTDAPPDLTPEVSDLRVAPLRLAGGAALFAAEQLGFAEEYGITMENVFVESSAASVTQLVSGDVQVAFTAYPGVVDSNLAGIPLVIVLEGLASGPGFVTFEALPGSGIESIEDFEGKRVGVTSLNSALDGRVKLAMARLGLDYDSVEFVAIPYDQVPANLETGTIDVGASTGSYQADLRERLNSVMVFDVGDGEFLDFAESGFVMTKDFAEANPNTVRAFQCSVAEAALALHADDTLQATVTAEALGVPVEDLRGIPNLNFQSGVRVDRLGEISDLMEIVGLIDAPFDMAAITVPFPTNC